MGIWLTFLELFVFETERVRNERDLILPEFCTMSSRVFPSIARQLARGGRALSQTLYLFLFFVYTQGSGHRDKPLCSVH